MKQNKLNLRRLKNEPNKKEKGSGAETKGACGESEDRRADDEQDRKL